MTQPPPPRPEDRSPDDRPPPPNPPERWADGSPVIEQRPPETFGSAFRESFGQGVRGGAHPYAPGAALPPATPTPPPKRHRLLPVLALGFVAVVILLIASALSSHPPTPADPSTGSAGGAGTTAQVGQQVGEGQLNFTVTKVKYTSGKVGETVPHGRWAVLTVKVTNVGDTPQTFYDNEAEGFVGAKRYSENLTAAALLSMSGGDSAQATEMGPGNTATVQLPFDIPKGKTLTRVVLHESPGSQGVTVALS